MREFRRLFLAFSAGFAAGTAFMCAALALVHEATLRRLRRLHPHEGGAA